MKLKFANILLSPSHKLSGTIDFPPGFLIDLFFWSGRYLERSGLVCIEVSRCPRD